MLAFLIVVVSAVVGGGVALALGAPSIVAAIIAGLCAGVAGNMLWPMRGEGS